MYISRHVHVRKGTEERGDRDDAACLWVCVVCGGLTHGSHEKAGKNGVGHACFLSLLT